MYQVKILTNDQMDSAGTQGLGCACVDEDNMGFADKDTNTVYVRYSKHPELMNYVINHELEHLEEEEGTHECEHGVRHKKAFKQILAPLLMPGISPFINKGFSKEAFGDALNQLAGTAIGGLTGGATGMALGSLKGSINQMQGFKKPTDGQQMNQPSVNLQQPSSIEMSMAGPVSPRLGGGLSQQPTLNSPLNQFKFDQTLPGQQQYNPFQAGYYQGRDPNRIQF